jgi:hypothetical protein
MRDLSTTEMIKDKLTTHPEVPAKQGSEMSSTVGEYTDATTHGGSGPRFDWQRRRSSGLRPGARIPESKQLNRYQAFLVASSLSPFRWWKPRRSRYSDKALHTHQGE